jgi:hypothetical protein
MITLMFSMFQSNEESSKKQERIQAVWKNKRNQIKNGNIVKLSQIPHWLEKSKVAVSLIIKPIYTKYFLFYFILLMSFEPLL